jgi:hypothetical protein
VLYRSQPRPHGDGLAHPGGHPPAQRPVGRPLGEARRRCPGAGAGAGDAGPRLQPRSNACASCVSSAMQAGRTSWSSPILSTTPPLHGEEVLALGDRGYRQKNRWLVFANSGATEMKAEAWTASGPMQASGWSFPAGLRSWLHETEFKHARLVLHLPSMRLQSDPRHTGAGGCQPVAMFRADNNGVLV